MDVGRRELRSVKNVGPKKSSKLYNGDSIPKLSYQKVGDSVFFYRQKDSGERWTKDAQQFVSQRLNLRHLNETRIKRTSLMKAFVTPTF